MSVLDTAKSHSNACVVIVALILVALVVFLMISATRSADCVSGGKSESKDQNTMEVEDKGAERASIKENIATSRAHTAETVQNTFSNDVELESQISDICSQYSDKLSVYLVDLKNEKEANINSDRQMLSASMIKLPILGALFKSINDGKTSLDESLTIKSEDVVSGSGTGLKTGDKLTIKQLAEKMIANSDNTATNVIISKLGKETINQYISNLGLKNTYLDHKLMTANPSGDNVTSADDISTILEMIVDGKLGNSELSSIAETFLLKQADEEGLSEGLVMPYKLGHKTGTISSARHDGGILYDKNGESVGIIVVMTQNMDEAKANNLMKQLCELMCQNL